MSDKPQATTKGKMRHALTATECQGLSGMSLGLVATARPGVMQEWFLADDAGRGIG